MILSVRANVGLMKARHGLFLVASVVLLGACEDDHVLEVQLDAVEQHTIWRATSVGKHPRLRVIVPEPGFAGLGIYAKDEDGELIGLRRLRGPDGRAFVSNYERDSDQRPVADEGESWLVVPFDDQTPKVEPGAWEAQFYGDVDTLEFWYRPLAASEQRAIDFVVFLDREQISRDDVHTALVGATELLDIGLGSVSWVDTGPIAEPVDTARWRQLLADYGGNDAPVIPLIIAEGAYSLAGSELVGFVPEIPAYPSADSTMSGMLVEHEPVFSVSSRIVAHELGHFLGLNHTTSMEGQDDGLSDTPLCGASIEGDMASCPDANNLMFVAQGGTALTPGQLQVIHASVAFTGGHQPDQHQLSQRSTPSVKNYLQLLDRDWCPRVRTALAEAFSLHCSPSQLRTLTADPRTSARSLRNVTAVLRAQHDQASFE